MNPRPALRELRDTVTWARRTRSADEIEGELAGLELLEKLRRRVAPRYVLGDATKTWSRDKHFMDAYRRLVPGNDRSAERKYTIRSLASAAADLPGDSVEAGVFLGATSWFICDALAGRGKTHHAFDSFEGLPEPTSTDGGFWTAGDLHGNEDVVRRLLAPYSVELHRGWIPDVFETVEIGRVCFVHLDVDLQAPTAASMEYFYDRLVPGGMLVCDDYGFATCPGVRDAIDEFMGDRPETIIELTTAQALIIKR